MKKIFFIAIQCLCCATMAYAQGIDFMKYVGVLPKTVKKVEIPIIVKPNLTVKECDSLLESIYYLKEEQRVTVENIYNQMLELAIVKNDLLIQANAHFWYGGHCGKWGENEKALLYFRNTLSYVICANNEQSQDLKINTLRRLLITLGDTGYVKNKKGDDEYGYEYNQKYLKSTNTPAKIYFQERDMYAKMLAKASSPLLTRNKHTNRVTLARAYIQMIYYYDDDITKAFIYAGYLHGLESLNFDNELKSEMYAAFIWFYTVFDAPKMTTKYSELSRNIQKSKAWTTQNAPVHLVEYVNKNDELKYTFGVATFCEIRKMYWHAAFYYEKCAKLSKSIKTNNDNLDYQHYIDTLYHKPIIETDATIREYLKSALRNWTLLAQENAKNGDYKRGDYHKMLHQEYDKTYTNYGILGDAYAVADMYNARKDLYDVATRFSNPIFEETGLLLQALDTIPNNKKAIIYLALARMNLPGDDVDVDEKDLPDDYVDLPGDDVDTDKYTQTDFLQKAEEYMLKYNKSDSEKDMDIKLSIEFALFKKYPNNENLYKWLSYYSYPFNIPGAKPNVRYARYYEKMTQIKRENDLSEKGIGLHYYPPNTRYLAETINDNELKMKSAIDAMELETLNGNSNQREPYLYNIVPKYNGTSYDIAKISHLNKLIFIRANLNGEVLGREIGPLVRDINNVYPEDIPIASLASKIENPIPNNYIMNDDDFGYIYNKKDNILQIKLLDTLLLKWYFPDSSIISKLNEIAKYTAKQKAVELRRPFSNYLADTYLELPILYVRYGKLDTAYQYIDTIIQTPIPKDTVKWKTMMYPAFKSVITGFKDKINYLAWNIPNSPDLAIYIQNANDILEKALKYCYIWHSKQRLDFLLLKLDVNRYDKDSVEAIIGRIANLPEIKDSDYGKVEIPKKIVEILATKTFEGYKKTREALGISETAKESERKQRVAAESSQNIAEQAKEKAVKAEKRAKISAIIADGEKQKALLEKDFATRAKMKMDTLLNKISTINHQKDSIRKAENISNKKFLKSMIELNEARIRNFIGMTFIAVLFCFLGIYYYKKNQQLHEQKSTITNQLDEIRHRVRNNLAALDGFIKTQKRNNKLPELVPPLERCRESIISMGRVNTALYQEDDWNKVSVKSYLESLMGVVLDAMNNNGRVIGFSLDICAAAEIRHWDTKEKSNLGFIVNELLSNASKYAFANQPKPHIRIAMQAQAGEQNILLTIQDNGCGIDKARYETRTKESLGMTIVSRSARTLGGDATAVTYENLPEGGTIFYIPIQIQ
jgi:two-component sensor histidine kinase